MDLLPYIAPIAFCPITTCQNIVLTSSILAHYLEHHRQEDGLEYREALQEAPVNFVISENHLKFGEIVCLGAIAYGGPSDQRSDRPAERGLCLFNNLTEPSLLALDAHLPFLILGCLVSWAAIYSEDSFDEEAIAGRDKEEDMCIFWIAAAKSIAAFEAQITIYDAAETCVRTATVPCRKLNDNQDPVVVLADVSSYLYLNREEFETIMQGGGHCKVTINELDELINPFEDIGMVSLPNGYFDNIFL